MRRIFGDEDPFSDFFQTFFGGAEPERRARAAGRRGRARSRAGPRRRAGDRADARGGAARARRGGCRVKHDGHTRTRGRPHSGRRQRRLARARRRRRRARRRRARGRRPLPARPPAARTRASSGAAATCTRSVAVPVTTAVLGGEADVPTLDGAAAPAEDPAGARRTARSSGCKGHGMPAVGQAGRPRRPVRHGRRRSCRGTLTPERAAALRGAGAARGGRDTVEHRP